jgi:putative ABC transport system ATP-binding protein
VRRLALCLTIPYDRTLIDLEANEPGSPVDVAVIKLTSAAAQLGIFVQESDLSVHEIEAANIDGLPIVIINKDGSFRVCEEARRSRIETELINDTITREVISKPKLKSLLESEAAHILICKKELECDVMSGAHGEHASHGHTDHPKPLRRFLTLLKMDRRDIWIIALFALVSGILSLATPLAVDALVSVVSWGTFMQPLIVLSIMLLVCLTLAASLEILQAIVVEILQRRQLVRIVGDLAHRFPRAARSSLDGTYPREHANRIFDIMTIQKASSILLTDGISLVLTTVLGLILLGFYHPFLLGFDLVLVITMISMTWVLGRGGVRTAIDESYTKYHIAHWLQDVISAPSAFKINGGETLAIERANKLTTDYLEARKQQFRVMIRQIMFAVGLQVIASTALLSLGGYLVITQQLTLGQLVASELVVSVVVGAFAKAGKSIEKYYDMLAGLDKVGHLLDLEVDHRHDRLHLSPEPASVRWGELEFHEHATGQHTHIPAASINAGQRVAITSQDTNATKLLLGAIAGLYRPSKGVTEISGTATDVVAPTNQGQLYGYAAAEDVFHGTIHENVDLGRSRVSMQHVRDALGIVQLWEFVMSLPKGLRTLLQTTGIPLSSSQVAQLLIARAIAGQPKLILIDGLLDQLPKSLRMKVWQALSEQTSWTILLTTQDAELASQCDTTIDLDNHHG